MDVLQSCMHILQGINDSLPLFTQSALNSAISIMLWIFSIGHSYRGGLLFNGIMSFILRLDSSIIISRAWNKKLIEISLSKYVIQSANILVYITFYLSCCHLYGNLYGNFQNLEGTQAGRKETQRFKCKYHTSWVSLEP